MLSSESSSPISQSEETATPSDSLSTDFVVEFWGVRGSIPTPGSSTVRYGGNTSCVEMRVGEKRLIFDGGTGLRVLGLELLKEMPVEAHIFFSHTHWDHIQGFPFFVPAFLPINKFHIYGAIAPDGTTIKESLSDQMVHPNFPIPLQIMGSQMKFYDFNNGDVIQVDDIEIETISLNHPNFAIGYRVCWQGKTVVYCPDTEHYEGYFDENILHLSRNADLLIYDATYTNEEYYDVKSPKIGLGHSTWEVGVEIARKAGVKQIAMFQHDPGHNDDLLDEVQVALQSIFSNGLVAKEGMTIPIL
ncbi:beta-lactamase-like [Trichodesmium erythraeum IMS101]|uniref:Beta-lactamase-like n=1 Tax=Trichodesmium erythraeum (strain IMS101) TaxID=203124 RepID=Q10VW5_TRIEI|nr:MBL fold metallo-hydrolase [Trichodesmium erythraeum GBRTRLIN201]MCH2047736.1 MBL fold metallo-hydrolase [Trichodesmium sp. ALOHA_ZT_67]MDT9338791.1 MBL fold metallo-hydrolase [Trichodesmium erythraeum 21-75]